MPEQSTQSEQEAWNAFAQVFCEVAGLQGRLAYCLMSVHAVNPHIFQNVTDWDPIPYLFWNMVYGISIMIASRPALRPLLPLNRFSFGLLGSLAFNHSSMLFYEWLCKTFNERPYLLTLLGYLSGRVMMVHLIAFLYHIDTRCSEDGARPRRNSAFEAMYL